MELLLPSQVPGRPHQCRRVWGLGSLEGDPSGVLGVYEI